MRSLSLYLRGNPEYSICFPRSSCLEAAFSLPIRHRPLSVRWDLGRPWTSWRRDWTLEVSRFHNMDGTQYIDRSSLSSRRGYRRFERSIVINRMWEWLSTKMEYVFASDSDWLWDLRKRFYTDHATLPRSPDGRSHVRSEILLSANRKLKDWTHRALHVEGVYNYICRPIGYKKAIVHVNVVRNMCWHACKSLSFRRVGALSPWPVWRYICGPLSCHSISPSYKVGLSVDHPVAL
jgi:hypothetical protein